MNSSPSPPAGSKTQAKSERGILLISYPKIVFLWPAWIVSIVAALALHFFGASYPTLAVTLSWTFLITLAINLIVLAFDFPRSTWLLLFFAIVAAVLGVALLAYNFPNMLPSLHKLIGHLRPEANPTFYSLFAGFLTLIFIIVFLTSRLDYWEVRPNELLHHHGILSHLERFSSPHLRIDKEINDIFEFLLLGSGRLILHPTHERRAIVLDNVFFINSKEKAITRLLGALQVQVREPAS